MANLPVFKPAVESEFNRNALLGPKREKPPRRQPGALLKSKSACNT